MGLESADRRTPATRRVGLIVPSSNTTIESELPLLLGRAGQHSVRFTFHSARMRMRQVSREELAAMNSQTERAASELADMQPDVVATACLVAIMAQGFDHHGEVESQISMVLSREGAQAPVVSSAGALIDGLAAVGATRIGLIAPYERPLTEMVVGYIEGAGIKVNDAISLGIADNCAVGALDPLDLRQHWRRLDLTGCDALVLSACVQMPSLPSIEFVQQASGLPTLSASIATARAILRALRIDPAIPGAGALLAGSAASN